MNSPLKVGLTGGIGSGKSAVASRLATLGVPVIDADQITRALCLPGQSALTEIVGVFGVGVLDSMGALDRGRLRAHIFADADARRHLESILHPRVRTEMARQVAVLDAPYAILVIPLLLEGGLVSWVDRVLVVDCPEERQIERVIQRDGVSRTHVESVLAVQSSRRARLTVAHELLHNDSDLESLHRQVDALHQRYLTMGKTVGKTVR